MSQFTQHSRALTSTFILLLASGGCELAEPPADDEPAADDDVDDDLESLDDELTPTVGARMYAPPDPDNGGLYRPAGTPVSQFGFASGWWITDWPRFATGAAKITGPRGIVRTGLTWDPRSADGPAIAAWCDEKLDALRARDLMALPSILTRGALPSDAEWTTAVRAVVRYLGPGGTYAQAHPGFRGVTDYELWNEPNSAGNLGGLVTPAVIAHLVKIGSVAMRKEAEAMGFGINIVGFAIAGINVDYMRALQAADPAVWRYIDTLSLHNYMRYAPVSCSTTGVAREHCVRSLADVRALLDANGGARVHLATTEGGYSGSNEACVPPNVNTEADQATYNEAAIEWIRARPDLDFDFAITFNLWDTDMKMSTATCGDYEPDYWIDNLGPVRQADLSLKPWGQRLRDRIASWN